jgi:hypothetical protein
MSSKSVASRKRVPEPTFELKVVVRSNDKIKSESPYPANHPLYYVWLWASVIEDFATSPTFSTDEMDWVYLLPFDRAVESLTELKSLGFNHEVENIDCLLEIARNNPSRKSYIQLADEVKNALSRIAKHIDLPSTSVSSQIVNEPKPLTNKGVRIIDIFYALELDEESAKKESELFRRSDARKADDRARPIGKSLKKGKAPIYDCADILRDFEIYRTLDTATKKLILSYFTAVSEKVES